MWWLGFVFHEMAFGLLSVFLPLYIVYIGGSLVDVGFMSALAVLATIPSSFLWGYACEKEGRYRRYILLSFLSLALIFYFLTLTVDIGLLTLLYVLLCFFHVAHEPPRNVLIAEFYTREEWEKAFAWYRGITEIGLLAGLLLGFFMAALRVSAVLTLLVCSGLHILAFALSLVLVWDPLLILERGLVTIERSVDLTFRGATALSKLSSGAWIELKVENVKAFCLGFTLFSLATNVLFTPMAIFLSNGLGYAETMVFALFAVNSVGGIIGYFMSMRSSPNVDREKSVLCRVALFRGLLSLTLVTSMQIFLLRTFTVAVVLFLMGFLYALFAVYTIALSMEILPKEKVGVYNAMEGLGRACGSLIGPLMAEKLGFQYVFLTSGLTFFAAYALFKVFK
ncbi:MAG: MFS transporter [Candidatus Bathyarchaeota archaeon]|nr:MFS transporter [Candidatus Bathyarchaeota archaeon]